MIGNNKNILEKLDWENFDFPLTLTDIYLEHGYYKIRKDSIIRIWRNNEFKLVGKIKGVISKESDIKYNNGLPLKKGAFIKGDTISCKSNLAENYKLRGCLFDSSTFSMSNNNILFEAELSLDSILKFANTNLKTRTIIDWHLCSSYNLLFPRITTRHNNVFPYKFRSGLDKKPEINEHSDISGYSISRDCIILQITNFNIIIQTISKDNLPDWSGGIAIEYRGDISSEPDSSTRRGIAEFIGFVYGIQLLSIGSTHYTSELIPILSTCSSPWGNNVISNCSSIPLPPIDFKSKLEINNIELTLSQLLTRFLILRKKYDLKDVLWKLWIGKVQPLGTNLPIFASGIEALADKYINEKKIIKKYSKTEKNKYRELIMDDLKSITDKTKEYQFSSFITDKVNNPFNYSIGEKMKLFFNDLGFCFSKMSIESKALQTRNKMAHGSMSDITDSEALEYMRYTNAYITLYNRIILKLLDFNGRYIDYYNFGHPLRKIEENIEVEEKDNNNE